MVRSHGRRSGISSVESVQTEDQTINNSLTYGSHNIGAILECESIGKRLEVGRVSGDGPTAASDDGWDTQSTADLSVSFSTAFASEPKIVSNVVSGFVGVRTLQISYSKTGVTIRLANYSTTDRTGNTVDVDWAAVGDD